MTQADRIREIAHRHFVLPARSANASIISISSSQVHRLLGLRSAFPAVCSALGGEKFCTLAGVRLVKTEGPCPSSTTVFHYSVAALGAQGLPITTKPLRPSAIEEPAANPGFSPTPKSGLPAPNLDLEGALVLVSCVKTKRSFAAPARELYCSPRFIKARQAIEARRGRWLILSAQYGLLEPDTFIAPYEKTLNTMGVTERRAWALTVMADLPAKLEGRKRVVFLAGASYREFLTPALRRIGITVEAPMAHMPNGVQLAWLGGLA